MIWRNCVHHFVMITLTEITAKALELPVEQRFSLAQTLWESIDGGELPVYSEDELNEIVRQRMKDQPDETWRTHEEVMAAALREFGCSK